MNEGSTCRRNGSQSTGRGNERLRKRPTLRANAKRYLSGFRHRQSPDKNGDDLCSACHYDDFNDENPLEPTGCRTGETIIWIFIITRRFKMMARIRVSNFYPFPSNSYTLYFVLYSSLLIPSNWHFIRARVVPFEFPSCAHQRIPPRDRYANSFESRERWLALLIMKKQCGSDERLDHRPDEGIIFDHWFF